MQTICSILFDDQLNLLYFFCSVQLIAVEKSGVERSSCIHVIRGKRFRELFFLHRKKPKRSMLFCFIIIYYCLRPIEHPELNRNLMQSQNPKKENIFRICNGKRGHFYANLFFFMKVMASAVSMSSLPLFTERTCVSYKIVKKNNQIKEAIRIQETFAPSILSMFILNISNWYV